MSFASTTQAVGDYEARESPCVANICIFSNYLFDIELETQKQKIVKRLLDLLVDRNTSRLGE